MITLLIFIVILRFFELLYSQKVRYGGEDKICRVPSKRKTFEAKSYCQVLSTPVQAFCPWKSIRTVKAPTRVAFFVLTAALGKILTLENLRKRNIMVGWCHMCKQCGESIDHLFLHCEAATEIWSAFLQLFGVHWVMPHRVSECLEVGGDSWVISLLCTYGG